MVTNVTSLTRSGLSDFVIQRASAVLLTVYTLCVAGFFIANPGMDHATLKAYFASTPMLMFNTVMVLATAAHAWIGMWTVGTDYIRDHYFGKHHTVFRLIWQTGTIAVLFVYVVWALQLFWSL